MLANLQIDSFRGFQRYEVGGLGRVNLLVGANNSGKTALLEAIELLCRGADLRGLDEVLQRRQEFLVNSPWPGGFPYDVRGLFFDRRPEPGSRFELSGEDGGRQRAYACTMQRTEFAPPPIEGMSPSLKVTEAVSYVGLPYELPVALHVIADDGEFDLPLQGWFTANYRQRPPREGSVRHLGTDLYSPQVMATLWERIALTEHEEQVIEALQIIEPRVERVAVLGVQGEGLLAFLRLEDAPDRMPLGSMGEGMKRLFGLALAIGTTASGDVLLIDEIDTGLHHSVLMRVWELIIKSAERFGFQVFATTHSYDCLLALAKLVEAQPALEGSLCVHRIDRALDHSATYSAKELVAAIRHEIEVR